MSTKRLKCPYCNFTTLEFFTNKDGEKESGRQELAMHVIHVHDYDSEYHDRLSTYEKLAESGMREGLKDDYNPDFYMRNRLYR